MTRFVCTISLAPTATQVSRGTVGVSGPEVEYFRALQLIIPYNCSGSLHVLQRKGKDLVYLFISSRFPLIGALLF